MPCHLARYKQSPSLVQRGPKEERHSHRQRRQHDAYPPSLEKAASENIHGRLLPRKNANAQDFERQFQIESRSPDIVRSTKNNKSYEIWFL